MLKLRSKHNDKTFIIELNFKAMINKTTKLLTKPIGSPFGGGYYANEQITVEAQCTDAFRNIIELA